jgi:hypothetical protein
MRRLVSLVVLAAAAGVPAHAALAQDCYGLNAARLCVTNNPGNYPQVDPFGSSVDECVYTGPSCTPVSVPVPTVQPNLDKTWVQVDCYVGNNVCFSPY